MRGSSSAARDGLGLTIVQVLATGLTYPVLSLFAIRLAPPGLALRLAHSTVPTPDLGFPPSPDAVPAAVRLQGGLWALAGSALALAVLALVVGCATAGTLVHRRWVDRMGELGIRAAVGATRHDLAAHVMGPLWRRLAVGVVLGTGLGVVLTIVLRAVLPQALLLPAIPFSSLALVAVVSPVGAAWVAARFDVRRALRRFAAPLRLAAPSRLAPVWGGGAYYGVLVAVLATAGVLASGTSSSQAATREWGEAADTLLFELDPSVSPERALSALELIRQADPDEEWHLVSEGALEGLGTRDILTVECNCVLGMVVAPVRRIETQRNVVTPGTFAALGVPIVEGREFTADDGPASEGVAVIDRGLIPRWGGQDPLGKRVRVAGTAGDETWYTIVGIVDMPEPENVATSSYPLPEIWFSALQHPPSRAQIAVRGHDAPPDEAAALATLEAADPMPVHPQGTLAGRLRMWRDPFPLFAALLAIVVGAAFVVGILGVSTLAWLNVRSRTGEIGVRRAIGACRRHVRRLVFVEVLQVAGVGIALGSILGRGLTEGLADRYAALDRASPGLLLAVGAVLGAAALLSALRPAARALEISPIEAIGDVS